MIGRSRALRDESARLLGYILFWILALRKKKGRKRALIAFFTVKAAPFVLAIAVWILLHRLIIRHDVAPVHLRPLCLRAPHCLGR